MQCLFLWNCIRWEILATSWLPHNFEFDTMSHLIANWRAIISFKWKLMPYIHWQWFMYIYRGTRIHLLTWSFIVIGWETDDCPVCISRVKTVNKFQCLCSYFLLLTFVTLLEKPVYMHKHIKPWGVCFLKILVGLFVCLQNCYNFKRV